MIRTSQGGTGLYTGPYFEDAHPRNITVHQNTVAYLPCTVKQLGDRTVSSISKTVDLAYNNDT